MENQIKLAIWHQIIGIVIFVTTRRTLMTLTPATPTWRLPDFGLRLLEPLSVLCHVFIMVAVVIPTTVMMRQLSWCVF